MGRDSRFYGFKSFCCFRNRYFWSLGLSLFYVLYFFPRALLERPKTSLNTLSFDGSPYIIIACLVSARFSRVLLCKPIPLPTLDLLFNLVPILFELSRFKNSFSCLNVLVYIALRSINSGIFIKGFINLFCALVIICCPAFVFFAKLSLGIATKRWSIWVVQIAIAII